VPELHSSKSGHGPNLVLLHGWGSSSKVWHGVARSMTAGFRVWCVDLPGHGDSHAVQWDHSLQQGAELLARVMPKMCAVVGWSLGGLFAQLFARQFPHRVSRLMLVSSAPRFVASGDWSCGMPREALSRFSRQYAKAPRQALQRFCALQVLQSEHARRTLGVLRAATSDHSGNRENIGWGLQWLEQVDLRAQAVPVGIPVRLLHGEADRVLPVGVVEDTAALWRQAEVERVAHAGHAPFVSHPDRFLQWIHRSTSDD